MSVYKIDPCVINQLREKYPEIELTFMVEGEESNRLNETKANGLKAKYKNKDFLISFYYHDGSRCYEVSEIGMIMDKIIGQYASETAAILMILDNT